KKVMHTGTLDLPQGEWLQIEAIGLLNNSAHASLAKQFIEFAQSKEYQESASFQMFVYPVTTDAHAPDFFTLVNQPSTPATLPPAQMTKANESAWLTGWTDAMIG
ncbi:MAG: thiamine ABC transporter substrate-binding protein, partial [Thermoplasmatota archaeon]